MRKITKEITLNIDGEKKTFRLTKPDAFSGVELLRLFLREQDRSGDAPLTVLTFLTALSASELRSLMTTALNHTEVILPAGPNPIMTDSEWGYPELQHDAMTCFRLTVESVTFTLSGFFGEGGSLTPPANPTTSRPNAPTSTNSSSSR